MAGSGDQAQLERWVKTWRDAGPALEAQKRDELERLDTRVALAQLAPAFEHARLHAPVPQTSGLIEQQRHLRKLGR